jgi:hypothetical protein
MLIVKRRDIPLSWIALLQVMMGLVFLSTWFSNLNKELYGDGFLPFIQDWADGTQFRLYAALGSHLDSLLGYAHGRHLLVPTRGQIARDHLFRGSIHLH